MSIFSRDYATGKTGGHRLQEVKARHVAATIVLMLSTGEKIETTKEHPIYVVGEGFVPAGRLAIGNSIVTRAGPTTHANHVAELFSQTSTSQVRVIKVETKAQTNTVYNFTVESFHTYFVGRSALWVHNAYTGPDPLKGDPFPGVSNRQGLHSPLKGTDPSSQYHNFPNVARNDTLLPEDLPPGPNGTPGEAVTQALQDAWNNPVAGAGDPGRGRFFGEPGYPLNKAGDRFMDIRAGQKGVHGWPSSTPY